MGGHSLKKHHYAAKVTDWTPWNSWETWWAGLVGDTPASEAPAVTWALLISLGISHVRISGAAWVGSVVTEVKQQAFLLQVKAVRGYNVASLNAGRGCKSSFVSFWVLKFYCLFQTANGRKKKNVKLVSNTSCCIYCTEFLAWFIKDKWFHQIKSK